jgi:RimJ/RimL family protein N-acetyltransferase
MSDVNEFGQPVGFPVPGWRPPPRPPREPIEGRLCRVEPLEPERHAKELFEAYALDPDARHWTYLREGPFDRFEAFADWIRRIGLDDDALFFAICERESGRAVGLASLLRIDPDNGTIEVGNLRFSSLLQRTPAATEAMFLLMRRVFELGYRRYEWKCDALNTPSRAAALRLGFRLEGIFRQARLNRGRNRDTAWFAILDREWPSLARPFERWLDPANFDALGKQRASLSELRGEAQRGS